MQKPNNHIKAVVIVPVFNEGPILAQVVKSLLEHAYTVVVVDDGSAKPVTGLPVTILRHRVNLGQGAALQTGFAYARNLHPDVVITFDADGQHLVEDIALLLAPLINGEADVALGSRFLPDSATQLPLAKKLVLQLARFINFMLSGVLLSDAHNGLRALNAKALSSITLTENRMAHASEILFEIKKHGLRYKEIPVHIKYTDYSKQKGQSARDSIKVLFDIVLHKLFK